MAKLMLPALPTVTRTLALTVGLCALATFHIFMGELYPAFLYVLAGFCLWTRNGTEQQLPPVEELAQQLHAEHYRRAIQTRSEVAAWKGVAHKVHQLAVTVLLVALLPGGCVSVLAPRQETDRAITDATAEITFFVSWSERHQTALSPEARKGFRERRAREVEPAIKQAQDCLERAAAKLGRVARKEERAVAEQARTCTTALQEQLRAFERREEEAMPQAPADGGVHDHR